MATIRVIGGVSDLAADCAKAATVVPRKGPGVVRRAGKRGTGLAKAIAQRESGPHGANYWKRVTGEPTGPLSYEFGPTGDVVGNAVGAGWRNGAGNRDLPQAADRIGPILAEGARGLYDEAFWG